MKKWIVALTLLMLFSSNALADTAMKYDCTNAAGISYLRTADDQKYYPTYLWVELDNTASGRVTITRMNPSDAAADSAGTVHVYPGGNRLIALQGCTYFIFVKTTASDCLRWQGLVEEATMASPSILNIIADAVGSPTPVTISDPATLWGYTNFKRPAGVQSSQILPVIGEDVNGATSLLCYANWTNLTGQFSIQFCIGPTATDADTFLTYPIDSAGATATPYSPSSQNFFRIDSLTVKQHASAEGIVMRLHNNGHPFLGYLRARVVVDGADDIRGFTLHVIKEY